MKLLQIGIAALKETKFLELLFCSYSAFLLFY